MVEIEEELVEETASLKGETGKKGDKERSGSWMELMGEDLCMKVIDTNTETAEEAGVACDVGDAVYVGFVGYCADKTENQEWTRGQVFQDVKDWLVVVVDKDVCPALEMGIRFLKTGEHGVIQSHSKFAFGPAGRKHGEYVLPPNSSVIYQVHVKSIVSAESKEFASPSFQIERALSKKIIGNDCYQNEWCDGFGKAKAIQLYRKGAEGMNKLLQDQIEPNHKEQAIEIQLDCLNNIAAVLVRAKQYGQAKEAATQVLLHDRRNLKGLLRAARAAMLDPGSSYEESDAAVAAAESEYPDNDDVNKLRAELNRRKRNYNKKSKAMFSRMAMSMHSDEPKKSDKMTKTEPVDKDSLQEGPDSNPSERNDDGPWWDRFLHRLMFYSIFFGSQFLIYYFFLKPKFPIQKIEERPEDILHDTDNEF